MLIQYPVEEEFSASPWDRCQSRILRNFGSICIGNSGLESQKRMRTQRANRMSSLDRLDDI